MTASASINRIALILELHSGLAMHPRHGRMTAWLDALRNLIPTDARVVVLSVVHGMGLREIAEYLEVSRTMVWLRLQRAKRVMCSDESRITALLSAE